MDQFVGKWTEESCENFEKYMEELGVNVLLRKVGSKTKANEEWVVEGDDITLKITSTFKNKTLKFKFGQEFDEETLDGRKVKSTITLDGGKIVHQQVGKPHNCLYVREIQGENVVATMTCQSPTPVTAIRKFKRV